MRPDMPPSRDGMSSLEALGTVGLAGVGIFVVAVVAMHLIRPDLDPMDRTISEYALGGSGWLMTVAWFAGGVGVLALALGLHRSLAPGDGVRQSVWLMVITALVGFVASGVFRTDASDADGVTGSTVAGQLHDGSGLVGFVALLVAAFVLRSVFARDPGWQDLSLPTRWFTRAMLAMFIARVSVVIVRLPGSAGSSSGSSGCSCWRGSCSSGGGCASSGARRRGRTSPDPSPAADPAVVASAAPRSSVTEVRR